jgi:glycosyltransferase involved in cell wall biosynthesis
MCSQKADTVITVSKSLLDHVFGKYPQAHAQYVPNGVNIPAILPAQEITAKWGLTKDSYILNLGRLVANKGVEYLIAAYKQLETDKKLVIVGDGVMETELQLLADNHPNIIFAGNQIGQTFGELFSNACLFVQPSESEGLSLSLLEAMSYHNPCLVSNIPANREVVGENGATFQSTDIEDLKNKLTELLASPDKLKANKEAMYTKVVQEYDWYKIVNHIVDIYTQAIAKK